MRDTRQRRTPHLTRSEHRRESWRAAGLETGPSTATGSCGEKEAAGTGACATAQKSRTTMCKGATLSRFCLHQDLVSRRRFTAPPRRCLERADWAPRRTPSVPLARSLAHTTRCHVFPPSSPFLLLCSGVLPAPDHPMTLLANGSAAAPGTGGTASQEPLLATTPVVSARNDQNAFDGPFSF